MATQETIIQLSDSPKPLTPKPLTPKSAKAAKRAAQRADVGERGMENNEIPSIIIRYPSWFMGGDATVNKAKIF